MATTPGPLVAQCFDSISAAVAKAPFGVTVHWVEGIPGQMGAGRAKGYGLGVYPYQTYVDDDDYVLPNAFACLAEAMEKSPQAIFTDSYRLHDGKTTRLGCPHHLSVYRRGLLDGVDFDAANFQADLVSRGRAFRSGNIQFVNEPVYVWRAGNNRHG